MIKNIFRLVLWLGIASVLGPGSSIPNHFDMLFLIGGIFLMTLGALGVMLSSKVRR